MTALANLIPDPSTTAVFVPRPAAQQLATFTGTRAVSVIFVLGDILYGMVESPTVSGCDEPFAYDLATQAFLPITGIKASTLPVSQPTSGDWVPPTMDALSTTITVTHPGFNTANGFIGWLDVSNPQAPVWHSGNLALNPLPSVPVACKQFGGRMYYACGNATVGSDEQLPLQVSNLTVEQVLTYGDSRPVTALGGLPLYNQLGGVVQSLIVFKGSAIAYQVTGDFSGVPASPSINSLNVATGTLAPNTICTTTQGLAFVAPDGLRILSFTGSVGNPIGNNGQGITLPFKNAVSPSRMCSAFNQSVLRITVQNGESAVQEFQEFWYDFNLQIWTGPHSFPVGLIQPWRNTFVAVNPIIAPPGTVAFTDSTPPSTLVQGSVLAAIGTVNPSADAPSCQMVVSDQNMVLPTSGWITAQFSAAPLFEVDLGPQNSVGTFYVWIQDPLTGASVVSGPVVVTAAPNVITMPTYGGPLLIVQDTGGSYGDTYGIGTISPTIDDVNYAINQSPTVAPTSGWVPAQVDGAGNYYIPTSTTTIPSSGLPIGTNYLWAQDASTGITVASGPMATFNAFTIGTAVGLPTLTYSVGATGTPGLDLVAVTTAAPYTAVAFYLGTSNTVPPTGGSSFIMNLASTNSDGTKNWESQYNGVLAAALEAASPGTYFCWMRASGGATSGYFGLVTGTVTIVNPAMESDVSVFSPPSPYVHGTSITVTDVSTPSGSGTPEYAIGSSNSVPPGGFVPMTLDFTSGGTDFWKATFAAPGSVGVYYLWLQNAGGGYSLAMASTIDVTS